MTLQEVLDMVQMRYPHAYSNEQVITMLNDIQQRIFRTLYKPETSTSYDLIVDNPFYPIDFSPDLIIDVVVNDEEYPYQNIEYAAHDKYYYIVDDNSIGLYPTPDYSVSGGLVVFHYKVPTALSASDLDAVPDLDVAWHMLLVYHTCRELAVIARDDMYNVFATEIEELVREYHKSNRAKPHKIQDVYGVGRGEY